jgi:hypothetical protein
LAPPFHQLGQAGLDSATAQLLISRKWAGLESLTGRKHLQAFDSETSPKI